MKRNKNIEILRACSILYVMLYHFYVVLGKNVPIPLLNNVIGMGEEIGVTMFFVISGFGIYSLLDSEHPRYSTYKEFVYSRWRKLAPQYYICIFVLLVLTENAIYIDPKYIMQYISHLFFLHSLTPQWSGAINGVLWTMGVLMQFYVLSFFIFKLQKRSFIFPVLMCFGSLLIKWGLYHFILPHFMLNSPNMYFIFGRQIYSALDNFIIGMLVAAGLKKYQVKNKYILWTIFFASITALIYWANKGYMTGIYYDTILSYTWHLVCAFLCGIMVYVLCMAKEMDSIVTRPFLYVSKYNYGFYLWHLVIAQKLVSFSGWAGTLEYLPFCILAFLLCIPVVHWFSKADKIVF